MIRTPNQWAKLTLGTLLRLETALKPGGVLYMSFKLGDAEREKEGRHFTDMDQGRISELLYSVPALTTVEAWVTDDRRIDRPSEQWMNYLGRKR